MASKYNHATPLECLIWQLRKKELGEDLDDENMKLDKEAFEDSDPESEMVDTDDEPFGHLKVATRKWREKQGHSVQGTRPRGPRMGGAPREPRERKPGGGIGGNRERKCAVKVERKITAQEQKLIDLKRKKLQQMKIRIE